MSIVPVYRQTGSALHACRASVALAFVMLPVLVAALFENPLVLTGLLVAEIVVALAAGVWSEFFRGARYALALALLVALINPLVSQNGLTVIVNGASVPVLGSTDVTLEAMVYGLAKGLRVLVTVLPFVIFSCCVDPDALVRAMRRASSRSALTVSLATRMVPALERRGRQISAAYDLRADARPASGRGTRWKRSALLARALAADSLERALDTAAVLEVRGYGAIRRPARTPQPLSRHDLAFGAAAVVGALLVVSVRAAGVGGFDAYPLIRLAAGWQELALVGCLVALVLAPFAAAHLARSRIFQGRTHV